MDFTLNTLVGCASIPISTGLFSPIRSKSQLARTESQKALLKTRFLKHRDSLCIYKDHHQEQDDDTASTLSMTSSSSSEDFDALLESSSSSSNHSVDYSNKMLTISTKKQVHFAAEIVSEVHTRPITTHEDKYYLHYSEHDYVDFKIEFLTGKGRTRRVSFERDVVSTVHTTPKTQVNHKNDLFYTESELQG